MSKMMSVTDVKLTQKWSQLSGLKKTAFPLKSTVRADLDV